MAAHAVHRGQVALVLACGCRGWRGVVCRHVLMHDVGEVHPLVAITIPVLGRIGLRARYLANTHSLRMVRAHQHGRLPVPRRAGLGAEPASVQVAAAGLRVAHTGLHDVDGAAGLVVTLLDIGE